MADQSYKREREKEVPVWRKKKKEKIPKHVFIIIITYYGVLMIFNYYCREPYGLINRDQSNARARYIRPPPPPPSYTRI